MATLQPSYWQDALTHLSSQDPVMKTIIAKSPQDVILTRKSSPLDVLIRAVIAQQISVKAADSIWFRFVDLCKSKGVKRTAKHILSLSEQDLRSVGLSQSKVVYIRNIASYMMAKSIVYFDSKGTELLKEELLAIKGIGLWTYKMFAIFYLLEPDIFPEGDLAVLRAVKLLYVQDSNITKEALRIKVQKLTQLWSPYNTVASWFLWAQLDSEGVNY